MAKRKYGHHDQRSITKGTLQPYRETVQKVIARNPQVDWNAVYQRWQTAVGVAEEALQTIKTSGKAHYRYDRLAAQMVCDIAKAVEPRAVFEIVAALYLLQEVRGELIKSDDAFRSIVIHSLQREGGTGRAFAKPKWRPGMRTGAVGQTVTYQLTCQRTRNQAFEYISMSLGGAAVSVAHKEMQRALATEKVDTAYREAVAAIV